MGAPVRPHRPHMPKSASDQHHSFCCNLSDQMMFLSQQNMEQYNQVILAYSFLHAVMNKSHFALAADQRVTMHELTLQNII